VASRPIRAHRDPAGDGEGGFAIVEILVGMGIFAVLAVGFAATMASSLHAQVTSRLRATANQLATEQVEQARTLSYDEVGTTDGNPVGTLAAERDVPVGTTTYHVQTDVVLVDDPVPGAFRTYADYKRLVVNVTRSGSTTSLARLRTVIAPPTQPSLTKAVVQAEVVDATDLTKGVPGVSVRLSGGPSAARTGLTDARGYAVFPTLLPTPASGPTSSYRIDVTALPAPWAIVGADQLPAEVAGPALATQTKVLRLRVVRQVPVQLAVQGAGGAPYPGPATVTITSSRGMASYPVTGGSVGPIQLWSGTSYAIAAADPANGWFSPRVTLVPTTAAATAQAVPMQQTATQVLAVSVATPTGPAAGITVRIKDGPLGVLLSGTTTATGLLAVAVPSGGTYAVEIDAQGGWAATARSVPLGAGGGSTAITLAAGP
jgi:type II secretory pathway pseudopilin PulG